MPKITRKYWQMVLYTVRIFSDRFQSITLSHGRISWPKIRLKRLLHGNEKKKTKITDVLFTTVNEICSCSPASIFQLRGKRVKIHDIFFIVENNWIFESRFYVYVGKYHENVVNRGRWVLCCWIDYRIISCVKVTDRPSRQKCMFVCAALTPSAYEALHSL